MSPRRNKLKDYLVYLALRGVVMLLRMFHWRAVYRVAARIGNAWYRLDGRHRDRAAGHVRQSFPDWPERKVQEVVRGSFRNLIYLAVEVLLTTKLITPSRWRRHVVPKNVQRPFGHLLGEGNSLIIISGHFGGWEVVGYTLATLGFKGYAVAKALDNPYLNEYLLGIREKMGLVILDKRGATRKMDKILKAGNYVAFIADQDYGTKGVFVDFFGRKASTYKAPALIAMRYKIPIAVGYGRRLGEQYRFEMGVERYILPSEWADKDDPVKWITQEYTSALESAIRRAPEQYLWIYRRWKTRPPQERTETNPAA